MEKGGKRGDEDGGHGAWGLIQGKEVGRQDLQVDLVWGMGLDQGAYGLDWVRNFGVFSESFCVRQRRFCHSFLF